MFQIKVKPNQVTNLNPVMQFVNAPIKNMIGRQWIEDELESRGGGTKKERTRLLTRRGHKPKPAGV